MICAPWTYLNPPHCVYGRTVRLRAAEPPEPYAQNKVIRETGQACGIKQPKRGRQQFEENVCRTYFKI